MATQFTNRNGEVVATRFFGGKERGTVVQVEANWTGEGFVQAECGAWVHCSAVTEGCVVEAWTVFHQRTREVAQERAQRFVETGKRD